MFDPHDPPAPAKFSSPGRMVALEGLDGSGGTTQAALLEAAGRHRGLPVRRTREPSDGPVGRLIRAELAGGTLGDAVLPYLFAADRRDHLDRVVLPAVARGELVVSDRYVLSSLAYQSPAHGLERVMALNADFPAPDLTLMLDLAPEACLERIERRGALRDRFESLDRLRVILEGYEAAIRLVRARGWKVVRVDGALPPEEVHRRVGEAVWPG